MKNNNIIIRVSDQEKQFIKLKAEQKDYKNISDFILSSLIYPEKLDKKKMLSMVYEVNKIGVNLNQLTYIANQKNKIDEDCLKKITEINLRLEQVINTFRSI